MSPGQPPVENLSENEDAYVTSAETKSTSAGSVDELLSHVLSIDLVLKEIFKNLSVQDLLNFSLVNKVWNLNARDVLREYKETVAHVTGIDSCNDLTTLDGLLETSPRIPFNGLSIRVEVAERVTILLPNDFPLRLHQCCRNRTLPDHYPSLYNLPMKYLKVKLAEDSTCPAALLVKKIFTENSGSLLGLTVWNLPPTPSLKEYFGISSDNFLRSLTKLEFPLDRFGERKVNPLHFQELILHAPKLKEVGPVLPSDLPFIFAKEKVKIVRDFHFVPDFSDAENCLKFAREEPSLKRLTVSSLRYWPRGSTRAYAIILSQLADSSLVSLDQLEITHLDLILVSRLRFVVFLQGLKLGLDNKKQGRSVYASLRKIDFSRLFPNLNVVELEWRNFQYGQRQLRPDYIERLRAEEVREFTCTTVNTLKISYPSRIVAASVLGNLVGLFPNVRHFYMESCHPVRIDLSIFWTSWSGLETLSLDHLMESQRVFNLDATFCGISHEEALELQGMGPEFLEKYHLVEPNPSIFNLKELKSLRLKIKHYSCDSFFNVISSLGRDSSSSIYLSQVTGHLAFARLPNLKVEIQRSECRDEVKEDCESCQKMEEMKPFVTFGKVEDTISS